MLVGFAGLGSFVDIFYVLCVVVAVYVVIQFYLCFKLVFMHYRTQTQRKIKFKQRVN